jgi:transmembrane sensor
MATETPNGSNRNDPADWEAIARYFAGESTPAESEGVRRWLEANPAEASALSALNDVSSQLVSTTPPGLDVEAALKRVAAKRDASDVIPIDSRRPRRPAAPSAMPARRWQPVALRVAATIVLLVGGGFWWHSITTRGYTNQTNAVPQTFETAVGKRDSVRLADGTRVVLAPESRLTVATGYGAGDTVREVELTGEAYFDVHHDAARPFVVHAGGATIRDIGTTFTVRSTGAEGVRVAVTSGSVSLAADRSPPNAAIVLRPGDAGTVAANGQALAERGGAAEPDTAWTTGRLVFREAPIADVRSELRRWYGVDLVVDSSFASRHLSVTFDGETPDRALEIIALSLGGQVQRQGNTATITPASPRSR